jgi:hypothetical protein
MNTQPRWLTKNYMSRLGRERPRSYRINADELFSSDIQNRPVDTLFMLPDSFDRGSIQKSRSDRTGESCLQEVRRERRRWIADLEQACSRFTAHRRNPV